MTRTTISELSIRSSCRVAIETQKRLFASDLWQDLDPYERGIYVGRCMMAQDILDKMDLHKDEVDHAG